MSFHNLGHCDHNHLGVSAILSAYAGPVVPTTANANSTTSIANLGLLRRSQSQQQQTPITMASLNSLVLNPPPVSLATTTKTNSRTTSSTTTSYSSAAEYQSVLISALLQQQRQQRQQRREEQQKVTLLQHIQSALSPQGPAPFVPTSNGSNNLAGLLHQQNNPLTLPPSTPDNLTAGGALSFLGAAGFPRKHVTGALAGYSAGGIGGRQQLDAIAVAKLLQSQQQAATTARPTLPAPQATTSTTANAAATGDVVALASQLRSDSGASGAAAGVLWDNSALSASLPGIAMNAADLNQHRRRKGRTGTFPQKLHQMLSDLEREVGGVHIASFLSHGRAFAIHKPRDFVKHVMPKYFRMSRFSSFQRQLNLYEFQRIAEGPDKGSYYHELFVQGRPILSTMMKRNKIKGVKNNLKMSHEGGAEEEEIKNDDKKNNSNEDEDPTAAKKEHCEKMAEEDEQMASESAETTATGESRGGEFHTKH